MTLFCLFKSMYLEGGMTEEEGKAEANGEEGEAEWKREKKEGGRKEEKRKRRRKRSSLL